MEISRERQGEVLVIVAAILWGLFQVLVVKSYAFVGVLTGLGWSTFFASIFFGVCVTWRRKWHELKNREAMIDALLTGLFLGVLYYVFIYSGLRFTTPGNASIIGMVEIFFTYLFFNLWRKEFISVPHVFGALFMVAGAGIVFAPNFSQFNLGDFLVVFACACSPFGNFFAQRARKKISGEMIFFIRTVCATPCLFLLAWLFGEHAFFQGLANSFLYLVFIGVVLLGIQKLLWIESIHRISVTKALSLHNITPLVTLFFAWLILSQKPTFFQLASFIPLALGMYLLTSEKKSRIQENFLE